MTPLPRPLLSCLFLPRNGLPIPVFRSLRSTRAAPLSTSVPCPKQAMPPRPQPPPDSDIEEHYLKGSGPGGQKINKTSSAVQLKHKPTGIVVKSQATRSRTQNRKIARQLLAERLDNLENGDQSRSAIVGEAKRKKAASAAKKSKRKYKKLEEGEEEDADRQNDDIVTAAASVTTEVGVTTKGKGPDTTDSKPDESKP